MNKKGMFFSLTVAMILLVLFVIFNNMVEIRLENKDFRVNRAKLIGFDNFVSDFDSYYAEKILTTAAKPALRELTESGSPFSRADLVDLMNDDAFAYTTNDTLRQALATLPVAMSDTYFSYELADVRQYVYQQFELEFHVDYHFYIFNSKWSKQDKVIIIPVTAYSLWHPRYVLNGTIDTDWEEDPTASLCYIEDIFNDVSCGADINIRP